MAAAATSEVGAAPTAATAAAGGASGASAWPPLAHVDGDITIWLKSSRNLGFQWGSATIGGRKVNVVRSVSPGGPLAESRFVFSGDVVAGVNGVDVAELSRADVTEVLKQQDPDAEVGLTFRLPEFHERPSSVRPTWAEEPGILAGTLSVRAQGGIGGFKRWNTRYFVLNRNEASLQRYKTRKEYEMRVDKPRTISLRSVRSVTGGTKEGRQQRQRVILTLGDGTMYKFEASSIVEARVWAAGLIATLHHADGDGSSFAGAGDDWSETPTVRAGGAGGASGRQGPAPDGSAGAAGRPPRAPGAGIASGGADGGAGDSDTAERLARLEAEAAAARTLREENEELLRRLSELEHTVETQNNEIEELRNKRSSPSTRGGRRGAVKGRRGSSAPRLQSPPRTPGGDAGTGEENKAGSESKTAGTPVGSARSRRTAKATPAKASPAESVGSGRFRARARARARAARSGGSPSLADDAASAGSPETVGSVRTGTRPRGRRRRRRSKSPRLTLRRTVYHKGDWKVRSGPDPEPQGPRVPDFGLQTLLAIAGSTKAEFARDKPERLLEEGIRYFPLRGQVFPPSLAPPVSPEGPSQELEPEFVYGYKGSGRGGRTNLFVASEEEIVYLAGSVVVAYAKDTHSQRFYTHSAGEMKCLSIHPLRTYAAVGLVSDSGRRKPLVSIFDLRNMEEVKLLSGLHEGTVVGVDFSADGDRILSVGGDRPAAVSQQRVTVTDWRDGDVLATAVLDLEEIAVDIVCRPRDCVEPEFEAVVYGKRCLRLVAIETAQAATLGGGADSEAKSDTASDINSLLGPAGATASAAGDGPSCVLKLVDLDSVAAAGVGESVFTCAAFTRDGRVLAGDITGSILVFRGAEIRQKITAAHKGAVYGMCSCRTPAGDERVLSGSRDAALSVWSTDDNEVRLEGSVSIGDKPVRTVHSADGASVVVGTATNEILHVSLPERRRSKPTFGIKVRHGAEAPATRATVSTLVGGCVDDITGIAAHPSDPVFAVCTAGGLLKVIDATSRQELGRLRLPRAATCVEFSPDGISLAVGLCTPPRTPHSTPSGRRHQNPAAGGGFLIVSCFPVGTIRTSAPERLARDQGVEAGSTVDGSTLMGGAGSAASGGAGGDYGDDSADEERRSDPMRGEMVLDGVILKIRHYVCLTQRREQVHCIRYSPGGEMIAVGIGDGHIDIYLLENSTSSLPMRKRVLKAHTAAVIALDWSEGTGRYLVSESINYELFTWEPHVGTQVKYTAMLRDVEWATQTCSLGWPVIGIWGPTSDGTDITTVCRTRATKNNIVTGDDYGRVNLFRYPVQSHVAEAKRAAVHGSYVSGVTFLARDSHLVSAGGFDGTVVQWRYKSHRPAPAPRGPTVETMSASAWSLDADPVETVAAVHPAVRARNLDAQGSSFFHFLLATRQVEAVPQDELDRSRAERARASGRADESPRSSEHGARGNGQGFGWEAVRATGRGGDRGGRSSGSDDNSTGTGDRSPDGDSPQPKWGTSSGGGGLRGLLDGDDSPINVAEDDPDPAPSPPSEPPSPPEVASAASQASAAPAAPAAQPPASTSVDAGVSSSPSDDDVEGAVDGGDAVPAPPQAGDSDAEDAVGDARPSDAARPSSPTRSATPPGSPEPSAPRGRASPARNSGRFNYDLELSPASGSRGDGGVSANEFGSGSVHFSDDDAADVLGGGDDTAVEETADSGAEAAPSAAETAQSAVADFDERINEALKNVDMGSLSPTSSEGGAGSPPRADAAAHGPSTAAVATTPGESDVSWDDAAVDLP